MVNINRNSALDTLQGLVEQSFSQNLQNMPQEFNEQQQMAFDLFKQRIFFEEVIEESISFNRNLEWKNDNENVKIISTAEELVDVYKLRSIVYEDIGYSKEFPDPIDGLNFDLYDKNSAIIYYKQNKVITGTCRLIFDSSKKLPVENVYSFDKFRENYNLLAELSRLVILKEKEGLGLEYKNMTAAIYNIYKYNDIDLIISGMKKDHYKWYQKFGGFNIEYEVEDYGTLSNPSFVTSWDPSQISKHFKRIFLNIR